MNDGNELIGHLLSGPIVSPNSNDIDIELLATLLGGIAKWLLQRKPSQQIWTGDMRPRDFGDPMQTWIANIGEAQV